MGLGIIKLTVATAGLPDGSSGNAAARPYYEKSSGTPPSGAPNVFTIGLLMTNAATEEQAFWQDKWPHDLVAGTITVRVKGRMVSATSSTVTLKAGLATTVDSNSTPFLDDAAVYEAKDTSAATTVPGTAKQVFEMAWTLTHANVAADRKFNIFIGRVQGGASGDFLFESADLEYPT